MADEQKKPAATAEQTQQAAPKRPGIDDDVVGKAYDSRLMSRLFAYLKPYKLQAGISAVAILIKSASDVFGPYLVKVAVDTYFAPTPGKRLSWLARHLSPDPVRGMTEIGALYLGSLLLTFGLEFVQTYLMQWTGQKIMFDLRSQIFRHIQRMHVGFFDRNPVGRLVTRVTSDVDALNEMFTSGVLAIFEDVFALTFIVVIMLSMSWLLALLTLSVIPAILYATQLFRIYVRESYRRQRAATAKINSFTQEYVSGMSVVQLFNREKRAFSDFSAVNSENKAAWTDAIFAYALYYPVVELLSSIAIALVIWRGGIAVLHGQTAIQHGGFLHPVVTVGILIAFIQYAQRFFRPIQDLSDKYNILQSAMAAAERVFKLLDTEPEIPVPAKPTTGDRSGRIEFRDVWFTYETLTPEQLTALQGISSQNNGFQSAELDNIEWILKGVSFTIEPDMTAAIVGHTGAGKTTITALMMRFYDVQRGAVLVDGIDVREQDLIPLRKRFGVVLQDPFLFSGTIAQNIRLGSNWITDDEVANAAEEVNVADFIRTLPAQFAEPVLERGSTLSTGQKQLISFARALAHKPGILILDEATSSVDTETELRVRLALERMITGRTSVLIAHRLSTIQRADTILVMHKGQLREQGSHQQLLALRGLYYKLYQLQYKDQELGSSIAETATA
ncbi:ABC transporter ATP-binding protein [Granulicella mallensis]|jgi:ATP-binding cassette, subfamily B, multidrug efflux pump|uniref:Multidrug resistance-like ATP-binding protein MdlA n=1 Tax=Granulicella mallensis TaxID=940614 RepID=A0A7W7ZTG9_9BACT|nr:ABC transporter ATP-binding protein [Granulicella mallensis]MBB5065488.1 ATP-binding cassette subfamily B protein [Granulicella mallensis]